MRSKRGSSRKSASTQAASAATRARSVLTESERALDSFVWRTFLVGEPVPTPDQVQGRLSPEYALAWHHGAARLYKTLRGGEARETRARKTCGRGVPGHASKRRLEDERATEHRARGTAPPRSRPCRHSDRGAGGRPRRRLRRHVVQPGVRA